VNSKTVSCVHAWHFITFGAFQSKCEGYLIFLRQNNLKIPRQKNQ
jgi:hypothetical protein